MTGRPAFNLVIVDDDVLFADSLVSLLETHGFAPCLFTNAEAFMDSQEEVPRPAIVLIDVRLSGKSGIELLADLQDDPLLVAVMITGHGDVPLAVRAIQKGALEFLEKPFPEEKLLKIIDVASAELEARFSAWHNERTQAERLAQLSPRENDVLKFVSKGQNSKQIAQLLGLSVRTVEMHRANLVRRLRLRSMAEALALYFEVEAAS